MDDMEIWKVIPNHENYEVSNHGRIRNVNGKMKKPGLSGNGYMIAGLYDQRKRTNVLVHRAVASAFIGKPDDGYQVNHIDGNKQNNVLSNLEYVTRSGNMKHAIRTGLHVAPKERCYGDDHWTRKHPELVARGDNNGARKHPDKILKGDQCPSSKLKKEEVLKIRQLFADGLHQKEIAQMFSVTRENINQIVSRKSWRHI